MNAPWTPEQVAYAAKQWIAGRSASQIARDLREAFGIFKTRNAVIGVLHRNGYSSEGRAVPAKPDTYRPKPIRAPCVARPKHTPPKPGQQNRPAVTFGKATTLNPVETEKQRQRCRSYGHETVARVASGADVESLNARPWMERKSGECKFPLGERGAILSCCNPVERGGYCEGHAAVCFVEGIPKSSWVVSARQLTKHDRIEPTIRQPSARPSTPWDEARAA